MRSSGRGSAPAPAMAALGLAVCLGAALLAGCTTTVVELSAHDAATDDGNVLGRGEVLAADAAMDVAPPDDAPAEAPDGSPTDVGPHDLLLVDYDQTSIPFFNEAAVVGGKALYVEYKCCADGRSCEVEIQGDGMLCQDLSAWTELAAQSCSSRGETANGIGLYRPC